MIQLESTFSKISSGQRQRIDDSPYTNTSEIDRLIKEEARDNKINFLVNKYFNKIKNAVIKADSLNKKHIHFYYNYYDFVNDGLGKPHGFLNQFMYEMCYEYSKYILKDETGNPITFKTLFGYAFKWELRGKNMMIISW